MTSKDAVIILLAGLVFFLVGRVLFYEQAVERFEDTLRTSIATCVDKYQLTMVLQERNESCEQGLNVLEEELDILQRGCDDHDTETDN
jgi:hypothetical protein